jgi:hypothetical protein
MILPWLLLMTQLQEGAVPARIVGQPDAPVVLIGEPCGDEAAVVAPGILAGRTEAGLYGPFRSEPFACRDDCQIGVIVTANVPVRSFQIGLISLSDRRRTFQIVVPPMTPASETVCHGHPVKSVLFPPGLATEELLLYVESVTSEGGQVWKLSEHEQFVRRITSEWQAKGRQR